MNKINPFAIVNSAVKKTKKSLKTWNSFQSKGNLNLKDMVVNQPYEIFTVKRVDTQFGKRIVLELKDTILYLPPRYFQVSDEDINNLSGGSTYVINKGEKGSSFNLIFKHHNELSKDEKVRIIESNDGGDDDNGDDYNDDDDDDGDDNVLTQLPQLHY